MNVFFFELRLTRQNHRRGNSYIDKRSLSTNPGVEGSASFGQQVLQRGLSGRMSNASGTKTGSRYVSFASEGMPCGHLLPCGAVPHDCEPPQRCPKHEVPTNSFALRGASPKKAKSHVPLRTLTSGKLTAKTGFPQSSPKPGARGTLARRAAPLANLEPGHAGGSMHAPPAFKAKLAAASCMAKQVPSATAAESLSVCRYSATRAIYMSLSESWLWLALPWQSR